MSSRGRHYDDHDDVESYRQRSRQNDRRHRDHEDDAPLPSRSSQDDDERKKQLARERKERMARLRDQLKKEDETLAALDKQQQQAAEQAAQEEAESKKVSPQDAIVEVQPEELEGLDPEQQMMKLMGIGSFGSTKGEAVADNQSTAARGGAAKNKARKYRQYMNRKNGFNRPLQKMN